MRRVLLGTKTEPDHIAEHSLEHRAEVIGTTRGVRLNTKVRGPQYHSANHGVAPTPVHRVPLLDHVEYQSVRFLACWKHAIDLLQPANHDVSLSKKL